MRTSLVLALLLIASAAHADPSAEVVRKQIVELTQRMMDAVGEDNADVWQRTLLDDALITDEFGRRQTKKEAVDSIHPFPAGISGRIEVRDPHVRVYGDTAVIDFEDYETETFSGQHFLVRYISTATYIRQGGAWKVATMLDVTLPTTPPAIEVRDLNLADYAGTYHIAADRAWIVDVDNGKLQWRTKAGRPAHTLDAIAKDVFMGGDDEKNLMIFRRNATGNVVELIERRKFNDLHLTRTAGG